MLKFLLRRKA